MPSPTVPGRKDRERGHMLTTIGIKPGLLGWTDSSKKDKDTGMPSSSVSMTGVSG